MSQTDCDGSKSKPDVVINCEDCAKIYAKRKYEFSDYAYNLTQTIIDSSQEVWDECLDSIPAEAPKPFSEYLRLDVEAYDFEPELYGYIFREDDTASIAAKKLELRPKYVALVEMAKKKFA